VNSEGMGGHTADDPRILVVDDEPAAEVIGDSLDRRLGSVELIRKGTIGSAVEYLREFYPTVDCVISDHGRQGRDASELLTRVEEFAGDLPVVVFMWESDDRSREVVADARAAVGRAPDDTPDPELAATPGRVEALTKRVADVLDRAARTQALEESNANLDAIHDRARDVVAADTVEEACELTVGAAHDALAFERCVLLLERDGRLVPEAYTTEIDTSYPAACDVSEGIAGRTYRTGETVTVRNLDDDPDRLGDDSPATAIVSVPVGDHGVFQIIFESAWRFDLAEPEYAEILVEYTATALDRIERERGLRAERDRHAALFERAPQPMVYLEPESGGGDGPRVVREVNAAYERTFDRPAREVVGERAGPALFPDDDADVPAAAAGTIRTVERETADGTRAFEVTTLPAAIGADAGARGGSAYVVFSPLE